MTADLRGRSGSGGGGSCEPGSLEKAHNLFAGPSVVRVEQSEGPHCLVPGASCTDVLREMQHEPEVMFEGLKGRAEKCGARGAAEAVGRRLAWAF